MRVQTVVLWLSLCLRTSPSPHAAHPSSPQTSGCFKVNNCKCIMKDGSGVIDLKAMGDADGFLGRLKPVAVESAPGGVETLFSFSPCLPFSLPEDLTGAECTDVAACLIIRYQRLRYIRRYISCGRHEGNEFRYNGSLKLLSVSYFSHGERPLTVAHYHCNPNRSTSFIRDQSLGTEGPLQLWVESPCACPNACAMGDLGLGTIFLIILSLSAAAYFTLGQQVMSPPADHNITERLKPAHQHRPETPPTSLDLISSETGCWFKAPASVKRHPLSSTWRLRHGRRFLREDTF